MRLEILFDLGRQRIDLLIKQCHRLGDFFGHKAILLFEFSTHRFFSHRRSFSPIPNNLRRRMRATQ